MFSLLGYSFVQNAFLASTLVALSAAVVGYFLLVRGLTFAGHAFSHIGFAGAAGAVWLGFDPLYGLLCFTTIAALVIGSLDRQLQERDITIGIIFTLALAFGVLFLFLYTGYAEQAYSILFGTVLGISHTDVVITLIASVIIMFLMAFLFRPLLFQSIDPVVSAARGISEKGLSILFLIIVALTVSISVQIVGVLLIFTLLVGPAATAMRLTTNPLATVSLAMLLGVLYCWAGILCALVTNLPVTFFIATFSFAVYLPVRLFIT